MRFCDCGSRIPFSLVIDGKRRVFANRSKCLACQPFNTSVYVQKADPIRRRVKRAEHARRKYKSEVELTGVNPVSQKRKSRKQEIVDRLGGSCLECGYSKCLRNLVFHHISDKLFALQERSFQFSWSKLLPEIRKCVLLCHNCHGEVHDGLVNVDHHLEKVQKTVDSW